MHYLLGGIINFFVQSLNGAQYSNIIPSFLLWLIVLLHDHPVVAIVLLTSIYASAVMSNHDLVDSDPHVNWKFVFFVSLLIVSDIFYGEVLETFVVFSAILWSIKSPVASVVV